MSVGTADRRQQLFVGTADRQQQLSAAAGRLRRPALRYDLAL